MGPHIGSFLNRLDIINGNLNKIMPPERSRSVPEITRFGKACALNVFSNVFGPVQFDFAALR